MTPRLLAKALALISPWPEQKDACAAMITKRVALLRDAYDHLETILPPGKLKKELGKIARDLKMTRRLLRQCSETGRAMAFGEDAPAILDMLDRAIDSAQFHHDALVVPPPSRYKWDDIKALTARLTIELLRTFGSTTPTKTTDGNCYALASLLYERISGAGDANLEQYCRDALDHANEPGGGRIEPSIVAKVPFAGR
jgi:hypothetical protein